MVNRDTLWRRSSHAPGSRLTVAKATRLRSRTTGLIVTLALLGGASLIANSNAPAGAERSGAVEFEDGLRIEAAAIPGSIAAQAVARAQGSFELVVSLRAGDSVRDLLLRAGTFSDDAARAASLIEEALPSGLGPDPEITLLLGEKVGSNRRLERVKLRTYTQLHLLLTRRAAGLELVRQEVAPGVRPVRFQGKAGTNLYWSMRASGVASEIALQFLEALGTRVPLALIDRDDVFDAIVTRSPRSGDELPALLYVGLERKRGGSIQLVNRDIGEGTAWVDPRANIQQRQHFVRPVHGRISSHFGSRSHPLLQLIRFHRGVDIAAPWGSPVIAVADGRVISAGSAGGYGRQVRLAHADGVETSYSHLSQIIAQEGSWVSQGQPIGYVGSSGLSTGPHLHYEVHKAGRVVDPLANHVAEGPQLRASDRTAVAARLDYLMAHSRWAAESPS